MSQISSEMLSWRLVHDGLKAFALIHSEGLTETIHYLVEKETLAEILVEINRLGLDTSEIDVPKVSYPKNNFLLRFTPTERLGFRTLAKTNVDADDFLFLISNAVEIDANHSYVIEGMNTLVTENIITSNRREEILYAGIGENQPIAFAAQPFDLPT